MPEISEESTFAATESGESWLTSAYRARIAVSVLAFTVLVRTALWILDIVARR